MATKNDASHNALKTKIEALKIEAAANSISPSRLATLLDEIAALSEADNKAMISSSVSEAEDSVPSAKAVKNFVENKISASLDSSADKIPSNKTVNDALNKDLANVAYLTCATGANVAAKTVTHPDFALSPNCRLSVKMTNTNTVASGVTLNINNTGANPLYYNGSAVNAGNTWEAGEILDVVYDGANFQSYNMQGGAGEGGNMILTFTTDVATTRKSVKEKLRRAGLLIAYRNASGEWVNEQYIGTAFTDAQWQLDSNWQTIASSNDIPKFDEGVIEITGGISKEIDFFNDASTFLDSLSGKARWFRLDAYAEEDCAITEIKAYIKKPEQLQNSVLVYNPSDKTITSYNVGFAETNISEAISLKLKNPIFVRKGEFIALAKDYYVNIRVESSIFISNYEDLSNVGRDQIKFSAGFVLTKAEKFPGIPELSRKLNSLNNIAVIAEAASSILGVSENSYKFGYIPDKNPSRTFGGGEYWVTVLNSFSSINGILTSITIFVNVIGTITLCTGVYDQNGIFVPNKKFKVFVPLKGLNVIKITEPIFIYAGEQIFIYNVSDSGEKFMPYLSSNSEEAFKYNIVYSLKENSTGEINPSATEAYNITFLYNVVPVNSIFALKEDLNEAIEKINSLQNSSYVYDSAGNSYTLRVVDGNVIPIAFGYKNVVILGNSLTWHPYWAGNDGDITKANWAGLNRSMASTTDDVSWPKLLEKILRKKNPDAQVQGALISGWEGAGDGKRNLSSNFGGSKGNIDAAISEDTDLIIFRAGENGAVSNEDVYYEEIKGLIDYCLTIAKSATIVMTSMFWPNTIKDNAIRRVAEDRGYKLIISGRNYSKYTEHFGDFHVDSKNTDSYVLLASNTVSHTADHGFYLWTNAVAAQLGYEKYLLDELYNINVNSSLAKGYYIKDTKSVYKSLVTILTYESNQPTCIVRNNQNQQITVRALNITKAEISDTSGIYTWAFCFIQPDSDVNVELK